MNQEVQPETQQVVTTPVAAIKIPRVIKFQKAFIVISILLYVLRVLPFIFPTNISEGFAWLYAIGVNALAFIGPYWYPFFEVNSIAVQIIAQGAVIAILLIIFILIQRKNKSGFYAVLFLNAILCVLLFYWTVTGGLSGIGYVNFIINGLLLIFMYKVYKKREYFSF